MSPNQQQKLEQLFLFLKNNGFNLTMENIASGIRVTPKTLFNRYQNKENMEQQVQNYWREKFWIRFQEKQNYCNNAIEELILLAIELNQSYSEERHFFHREFQIDTMLKEGISPIFLKYTSDIINSGVEKGLFREQLVTNKFTDYFLFNICTLFLNRSFKSDILRYIFVSLLTDYGRTVFNEIDLEVLTIKR